MAYKVVLTRNGLDTYHKCVSYILEHFRDKFAARKLVEDIEETLNRLRANAKSYPPCEDEALSERELRKVHLGHHKYKIFYHIVDGNEVQIDAILHDKQDFKNILS